MLNLSPDVRLEIYNFVLVYESPISFTKVKDTDTSLLQTCKLIRAEALPIFYGSNTFYCESPMPRYPLRLREHFGKGVNWLRYLTIRITLEEEQPFIDQLWKLTHFQMSSASTVDEFLDQFPSLQCLSIQLTLLHNFHHQHFQTGEILRTSLRTSCIEIGEQIRNQLGHLVHIDAGRPGSCCGNEILLRRIGP